MQIVAAESSKEIEQIRELFIEYSKSLEVDLCFQGFKDELASLPGRYSPPEGRLLLALEGGMAAGCAALRKVENGICEMKRLYVRPRFRGRGIGTELALAVLQTARNAGYKLMRLDTLPSMKQAIEIYRKLGFRAADPYYDTRGECTVFMEADLAETPTSRTQDPERTQ
jgi:ribosomal protein S18 acetylase RimI-like enzyme